MLALAQIAHPDSLMTPVVTMTDTGFTLLAVLALIGAASLVIVFYAGLRALTSQ